MKVHSIRGSIPDRARPPDGGPGIETQADIANRLRPREDISEVTYTDLPLFTMEKPLYGAEVDKDGMAEFIRNMIRSRPLVQEWLLSTGEEYTGTINWRTVTSARDLSKYSTADIGRILASALAASENVAAARVSTQSGIVIGTVAKPVTGKPSLTLWYKKVGRR
jgi:hypothetical protein